MSESDNLATVLVSVLILANGLSLFGLSETMSKAADRIVEDIKGSRASGDEK